MVDLDNILIFVKAAQFESITRAARSLGMPISTVSRRLSVLESELGVSLLRRTTRRITLTAQGREYFSQYQEPLNLAIFRFACQGAPIDRPIGFRGELTASQPSTTCCCASNRPLVDSNAHGGKA